MGAVEELAHRSLEECDQLAQDVSVHAQCRAIVESTAAGVAGIVGAALYIPVLLGAAIRAFGGSATATATRLQRSATVTT